MLKKILVFLCCMMICLPAQAATWQPIPDALRFTSTVGQREKKNSKLYVRRTFPKTALPQVDREIADLINALAERADLQPEKKCKDQSYLDVMSRISRSGQSMMSFLVIARQVTDRVQKNIVFENRVYDMLTGERITLSHLFEEDSDVWAILADAVRSQLQAYYPTLNANAAALDELCQVEKLKNAAFSLTPVQLELHYYANTLYPGQPTLMHVRLPYRTLRPYMNDYALKQTDNNGYQLTALTYDDGPVYNATNRVLDALMTHGASATFFLVGSRMKANRDMVVRDQDAGFSIGCHGWEHVYAENDNDVIRGWITRFNKTMSDLCGAQTGLLRAPGGKFVKFQKAKVNLPLFQWSVNSTDADSDLSDAKINRIARNVGNGADAGSIVLMHDMNAKSDIYTEKLLDMLEERNILCVTIEELFLHYGIELQGDQVYYGLEDQKVPPIQ